MTPDNPLWVDTRPARPHLPPMTRWLTIALTLIGFTVAMSAVSSVVNATVPGVQKWLVQQIGHAALDLALILIVLIAGAYGYLGYRIAGTRPNGM